MGTTLPKREPFDGLGNHIYLEKQDKLREIGVDIPTSQVSDHQEGFLALHTSQISMSRDIYTHADERFYEQRVAYPKLFVP